MNPHCPYCDCRNSVELIGRRYVCSGCAKDWPAEQARTAGNADSPRSVRCAACSPASDVNGIPMFDP